MLACVHDISCLANTARKRELILYNNVQINLQHSQPRLDPVKLGLFERKPSCRVMKFDSPLMKNRGMDFVIEVVEEVLWRKVE